VSEKDITLLSGADAIPSGHDPVGLLFECAPDGAAFRHGGRVEPLGALVGDIAEAKGRAYGLARKLLEGEPRQRGIRQLGIFEEVVIGELQRAFHSIHLHRALQTLGIRTCRVPSAGSTVEGLRAIQGLSPASYRLQKLVRPAPAGKLAARGARVLKRLRGAGFSAAAVRAEWRQAMNVIDPYRRRAALARRKVGALQPGGIWFYSTAYTYSRAGMMYEPYFPEAFTWLVENPHTGGIPLEEARKAFVDVHSHGKRAFRPAEWELERARAEVVRHLQGVTLHGEDEPLARKLLMGSRFFSEFLGVHLRKGLYFSALFESMLDAWRPSAVAVGNPVFEGYLLHPARERGIPTVLLQHGILGDYCQFWDPPVDFYIVRGSFWREFLAESPRRRAVVLNPRPNEAPRAASSGCKHVLFLTAPVSIQDFHNELDLDEILQSLLDAAAAHHAALLVRVHPLEGVDYYRRKIEKLRSAANGAVEVRYSHGAGLDEAVREACVAVTYCSTVFLDCLRARVPVVSFGWHDFSFRRQIEACGAFPFARSLAELRALVGEAIVGRLPPYAGSVETFMANSEEAELAKFFSGTAAPGARKGAE
jgi:hypothetical protein